MTVTAPASSTPNVAVSGPSGFQTTIHGTQTLTGLAPGSYTIAAASFVTAAPIVGNLYDGAVSGSPVSVTAGGSSDASVTYAQRPGSGGLWITDLDHESVWQYSAAQLAGSTSDAPAVRLIYNSPGAGACAFDTGGNLWVAIPGAVVEYTASQLASSGQPTPAVTLTIARPTVDAADGLAFDAHGNLWVMRSDTDAIVAFTPSQLTASGSPTPSVVLMSGPNVLAGNGGLAFDAAGNLWVVGVVGVNGAGFLYGLLEYTPSQLVAGGSQTPAVVLSPTEQSMRMGGLAFDKLGNLWVVDYHNAQVIAYAPSQLTATGFVSPTVAVHDGAGLFFPAFDASGDLWVTAEATGQVLEFATSQLAVSGSPAPNAMITLPVTALPIGLAFDPYPPNVPLSAPRDARAPRRR